MQPVRGRRACGADGHRQPLDDPESKLGRTRATGRFRWELVGVLSYRRWVYVEGGPFGCGAVRGVEEVAVLDEDEVFQLTEECGRAPVSAPAEC